MARLKITQTRSEIGSKDNQRQTLRSLGLKRVRDVVVKEDRPEIRGMVQTVTHLVTVEEVVNLSRQTKAERFPVLNHDGQIIGLVNTIDLVVDRASNQPVGAYARRIVQVRSDEQASRAMRRLRATPQHFALVVNEQGSAVGVVGLSNLLNPLVRVSGTETPAPQSLTLRT